MSMKIFTDRLINVTQKLSELRYTTSGLAFATMVALFVTALTMGTAAQATILAAGAAFGGPTQAYAVCYLYNASNTFVTVSGAEISQQNLGPVRITSNSCLQGLFGVRSICAFTAPIVDNAAHACQVTIPDGADIRGTFEIENSDGTVLHSVQLR